MVATVGAPVGEQAQRRTRPRFSLQEWLDTEASKYAWALLLVSIVGRGASFYSGGALSLPHLLGPRGMSIFDGITGVGIAFGCEMVSSIAGRAWQRNEQTANDAASLTNVKARERAAIEQRARSKARLDFRAMCLGILGSVFAAFMFLFTANGDHSIGTLLDEALVTSLLVGMMTYLGVFNTTPRSDPAQIATAQALDIRSAVTDQAGRRIASGIYSPDDVYSVAGQLPKGDKEKFIAALVRPEPDDPMWGTREMADWLGLADLPTEQDEAAARRRLVRLLAKVAKDDARIQKDAHGKYQVPRSLALTYLAELYIELRRGNRPVGGPVSGDNGATGPRQSDWLARLVNASDAPQDGTGAPARSDAGQAGATPLSVS